MMMEAADLLGVHALTASHRYLITCWGLKSGVPPLAHIFVHGHRSEENSIERIYLMAVIRCVIPHVVVQTSMVHPKESGRGRFG
jgi:hypothetical protein